jgi:fatty acid-binding protein DegV
MSWERDLAQALAGHDLVAAGHKLVADTHAIDLAQRAVVAAIDRAIDDGVAEGDVDAALAAHADRQGRQHPTTSTTDTRSPQR